MLMGREISSGFSLSQRISGVGMPSATKQDSLTLPPILMSPSHWHTGSEGGTIDDPQMNFLKDVIQTETTHI